MSWQGPGEDRLDHLRCADYSVANGTITQLDSEFNGKKSVTIDMAYMNGKINVFKDVMPEGGQNCISTLPIISHAERLRADSQIS